MTSFEKEELIGESGDCASCGSLAVKYWIGEVGLCSYCYENLGTHIDMFSERLLGVIIDIEATIKVLKGSFASPTTKTQLLLCLHKIEEAKQLLKDENTKEAKELADVSEEED